MRCIYNGGAVFDWDENNLRKIRAHRIRPEEVEQGLSNCPILIYEQDVQRVATAYDLDAGQKRDYLARRVRGE